MIKSFFATHFFDHDDLDLNNIGLKSPTELQRNGSVYDLDFDDPRLKAVLSLFIQQASWISKISLLFTL